MSTTQHNASAVQNAPTGSDPWQHLRTLTLQRNDALDVVGRYDRMRQLAMEQYNALKDRPKTSKETKDMLLGLISWLGDKRDPLWATIEKLEIALHEETERLNND